MTQLILDVDGYNVVLPEAHKGAYYPRTEELGEEVPMISGELTFEIRGTVWVISYQYGYLDDEMKNAVIAACEKGRRQEIVCGFLSQESTGELSYSKFLVRNFKRPSFMWSRDVDGEAKPLWGNFSLELREVEPHD